MKDGKVIIWMNLLGFDMNDPDNKKAFITGLVVGEELKKSEQKKKPASQPQSSGDPGASLLGTLIGIIIVVIMVVLAFIFL